MLYGKALAGVFPFLKGNVVVALGARGLQKHLTEEEGGRKFGSGVFAKHERFRSCVKGDTSLSLLLYSASALTYMPHCNL